MLSSSPRMPCVPHTRPDGHGRHCEMSVLPLYGENVPGGQRRHVIESASERYMPAGQIDGMYVP